MFIATFQAENRIRHKKHINSESKFQNVLSFTFLAKWELRHVPLMSANRRSLPV